MKTNLISSIIFGRINKFPLNSFPEFEKILNLENNNYEDKRKLPEFQKLVKSIELLSPKMYENLRKVKWIDEKLLNPLWKYSIRGMYRATPLGDLASVFNDSSDSNLNFDIQSEQNPRFFRRMRLQFGYW